MKMRSRMGNGYRNVGMRRHSTAGRRARGLIITDTDTAMSQSSPSSLSSVCTSVHREVKRVGRFEEEKLLVES